MGIAPLNTTDWNKAIAQVTRGIFVFLLLSSILMVLISITLPTKIFRETFWSLIARWVFDGNDPLLLLWVSLNIKHFHSTTFLFLYKKIFPSQNQNIKTHFGYYYYHCYYCYYHYYYCCYYYYFSFLHHVLSVAIAIIFSVRCHNKWPKTNRIFSSLHSKTFLNICAVRNNAVFCITLTLYVIPSFTIHLLNYFVTLARVLIITGTNSTILSFQNLPISLFKSWDFSTFPFLFPLLLH